MTTFAAPSRPLRIAGRDVENDGRREVVFASPLLLAPMEGVTDRTFRTAVLDLGGAGGACTEFLRISVAPIPARVMRRELGPPRTDVPGAVQLMSPGLA